MSKLYKLDYDSPIGVLELISSDDSVLSICFVREASRSMQPAMMPHRC
jgi:hypothetical protein|nr:hypothetical protein [Brevibacillus borstelensis]